MALFSKRHRTGKGYLSLMIATPISIKSSCGMKCSAEVGLYTPGASHVFDFFRGQLASTDTAQYSVVLI
jgi:hypothetical protein